MGFWPVSPASRVQTAIHTVQQVHIRYNNTTTKYPRQVQKETQDNKQAYSQDNLKYM